MKKFIALIVPVVLLMVACNNETKPTEETTVVTEETDGADVLTTPIDSATEANANPGSVPMPAQVWEDIILKPIEKATVVASTEGQATETVLTDASGKYSFEKLTKGVEYSYSVEKEGYEGQKKSAVYEGLNSLPEFALVKVGKK